MDPQARNLKPQAQTPVRGQVPNSLETSYSARKTNTNSDSIFQEGANPIKAQSDPHLNDPRALRQACFPYTWVEGRFGANIRELGCRSWPHWSHANQRVHGVQSVQGTAPLNPPCLLRLRSSPAAAAANSAAFQRCQGCTLLGALLAGEGRK